MVKQDRQCMSNKLVLNFVNVTQLHGKGVMLNSPNNILVFFFICTVHSRYEDFFIKIQLMHSL